MTPKHLDNIDAAAWPGIVAVPASLATKLRTRYAEADFARICAKAQLSLDPEGTPDLIVDYEELFPRLAAGGWLGFAESYLAGEWRAPRVTEVLVKLLRAQWTPRTTSIEARHYEGVELPPDLVTFSTGRELGMLAGVFSSGVATTVREAVENFVPGARQGHHLVDITRYAAPTGVERPDLSAAQQRAVEKLLAAAGVRPGTHLLEQPAQGGAVALIAAQQRGIIDVVTSDSGMRQFIEDATTLAGVTHSAHVELGKIIPDRRRGHYEAIVSIDHLELFAPQQRLAYLRAVDRLLVPEGRLVIQAYVATEAMTEAARKALGVLRAYIWPSLNYPRIHEFYRAIDRHTGLRVVAQTHIGSHAAESLRLQREEFQAHQREVAAGGFDVVFRRLWRYQFALREALLREGMLDCVQWTLRHRNRGGRR